MRFALVALLLVGAWALYSQRTRVLFEGESEFGRVRVTEARSGVRSLYTGAGRARQSAIDPRRPLHLEAAYTRVGMIGLALVPPDARILFVGLGGGAMPAYTRRLLPHAIIDVVEIDPLIVDVAQQYFGFQPDERMRVHTGDGRAYIEDAAAGTYHLIVLDAFSDDEIPRALATRQFLAAVGSALTPDGIVVSNLWTGNADYASMLATYDAVFGTLHLLRVPRHRQRILVTGPGADALDREQFVKAAAAFARRTSPAFDLQGLVEDGYEAAPAVRAPVLEDTESGEPAQPPSVRLPAA